MTSAAQFVAVSQIFGDMTAVDNINLDIPSGKFTTLLGPSGCGKTTTLRMLAGYTQPTSGKIFIDGKNCTGIPPEKRELGMVFQSYALFPHLSVADNVGYGLKMRGIVKRARITRIAECLELVGLAGFASRRPRTLSGGQQQRVALARALAISPKILLLDEPLSGLDARLRAQMRAEIRRIQNNSGVTVVLVTHDQDEALEVSDQMVLMRAGKIMQQGTPAEIFVRPINKFVADFLGYQNFFYTDKALITVRPEHLVVTHSELPRSTDFYTSGIVTDAAYRGVDFHITVKVQDARGDTTLVSVIRAEGAPVISLHDRVTVSAPWNKVVTLP